MKASRKEARIAYLFLLPNFLGFLIFTSIPVLASFGLSFFKWDLLSPAEFAGFANFIKLIRDPFFWKFTGNTLFMMLGIPIGIMGSLVLALALNQRIKGIVFFRTIYFLPTICAGVAIFVLWRWIYNADYGLINTLIARFGDLIGVQLSGPNWLTSTAWAKPALMIVNFWLFVGGYNMVLYLAALQGIPKELYEAADMDGANGWQKFWTVTWPMISPTTFFITIMSIIGGFQGFFTQAYIMTGGGPHGTTTTISYYIYNNAYVWWNMGYAAAIAWFLFLVIFIVTLINWRFGGKLVYY